MAKANDESWYFTKEELENTPTQLNGKTYEEEMILRKDGSAFIQEVGVEMRMPQLTIATAIVFFQRFYVYKSFLDYPPKDMGTVSLFLAGKVEETPKKLKEILMKAELIKSGRKVMPREDSETISFDLTVEHPYKYLLGFCKALKSDKSFAQTAWNFVNDSLRSTVCIQYHPRVVACAVILLSSKMRGFVLPDTIDGKEWYKAFVDESVTKEELEAIGEQIKQLYPEEALQSADLKGLLHPSESHSRSTSPHQRPFAHEGRTNSPFPPSTRPDGNQQIKRPAIEGEASGHHKTQRLG